MTDGNEDLIAIEGIRQGDARSFALLYERHRDRVYGFSYRMLRIQSTAEDVTHDVFLILMQHPEKYQAERGSLLTFLCAMARNCILNHFRHRRYEVDNEVHDEETILMRNQYEPDPLSSLIEQELAMNVNNCIALLPPLQREVIILRKFLELSYREISVVTSTDVNVVKARLHRARLSLAGSLTPYLNVDRRPLS